MLNKTLFKKSLQSNYKLVLIFMAILTMYFSIIAGMYDPDSLDIVEMLASMKLSPELLNAMGFTLTDTSLLGFISSYFYGLLMLAFPMVCYIMLANKLVASQVDKGSMAYLLATPNTRKRIAITQGIILLIAIFCLVGFVTALGIIFCQLKFPELLDINKFLLLNLGVFLLHFAISGICFFSSCIFNESKNSLFLGAGLPIVFLLIQMISNAGKELENFRYFTLFTLFNPADIIAGENVVLPLLLLGGIGAVLYISGIIIFDKRDLPI